MNFLIFFPNDKTFAVVPAESVATVDYDDLPFAEWAALKEEVWGQTFYEGQIYKVSVLMAIEDPNDQCLDLIKKLQEAVKRKISSVPYLLKYLGVRCKSKRSRVQIKPLKQLTTEEEVEHQREVRCSTPVLLSPNAFTTSFNSAQSNIQSAAPDTPKNDDVHEEPNDDFAMKGICKLMQKLKSKATVRNMDPYGPEGILNIYFLIQILPILTLHFKRTKVIFNFF